MNDFWDDNYELFISILRGVSKKSGLSIDELIGDCYIMVCKYVDRYNEDVDIPLLNYVEASLRIHYKYYYSISTLPCYSKNDNEVQLKDYIPIEDTYDKLSGIVDEIDNERLRIIIHLLIDGYNVKGIAEMLHLSIQSIYNEFYKCRTLLSENDPTMVKLYSLLKES